MAVRQQDINSAMMSVLKKMDVMLQSLEETSEKTLLVFDNIETLIKNKMVSELKKQTKILYSIESKISSNKEGGGGSGGLPKNLGASISETIGSIPDTILKLVKVLAVAYFFKKSVLEGSDVVITSLKNLLNFSKDIEQGTAAKSILFFSSLSNSSLEEFVKVLSKSFSLLDILNSDSTNNKMLRRSSAIAVSARFLLSASKNVSFGEAVTSILFYELIASSKIEKFAQVLTKSFGILFTLGFKDSTKIMPKRAAAIAESATNLLMISKDIPFEKAILSMLYLSILSFSIGSIRKSLVWAAILAPLVMLGSRVMRFAIRNLTKGMDEIVTSGENIIKIGIYLGLISLFIGSLIFSLTIAAILSPFILIGSATIYIAINAIAQIKKIMDANKIDKSFISQIAVLATAIVALVGAVVTILAVKEIKDTKQSAITIGFFLLTMSLVSLQMIGLSYVVKKLDLKLIDVFTAGLMNLVNAISAVLTSKVIENMSEMSYKKILQFALISFTLAINLGIISRLIKKSDLSISVITSFALFTLITIGIIYFVNSFAQTINENTILGILLFSGIVLILSYTYSKVGDKAREMFFASFAMVAVAGSLVAMSFALNVYKSANFTLGDSLVLLLTIGGLALVFREVGKGKNPKEIALGASVMFLVGLSLIAISFALNIYKFADFEFEDSLVLLLTVGGLALVYRIAGEKPTNIALGAGVMLLVGLSLIGITIALMIYKSSNFKLEDTGVLLLTLGGIALVFGIAGIPTVAGFIALGAVVFGLAALAIWGMSMALKEFQSLTWTETNSDNLAYTIKTVLGALSGTSEKKGALENITGAIGQGLQAILSLVSIGPLLLGSAAIWIMSMALKEFRDVKWDATQNKELGDTITMVLSALRGETKTPTGTVNSSGGPLDAILSLMGAGALLFAAGSIWLLSEALLKFKDVKWDGKVDTPALTFTISEITKVMAGAEGEGGLIASAGSFLKSAIGAGTSAANATSLGISSLAIMSLSEALKKWKGLGWGPGQTNNLTNAIGKILLSFKSTPEDGLYKVANNFDRIQNSMKLLKEHINGMDLQKLTLTDSMMKSIALLSKSPEAIGEKIAESIEKAFEDLAKAIKESTEDIKTAGEDKSIISNAASSIKDMFASKPASAPTLAPQGAPPTQQITPQQLQQALTTALASYFNSATIKIKEA